MKKIILVGTLAISVLYLSAQEAASSRPPKEQKIEHSFLWGLFQSKDYQKRKEATIEFRSADFVERELDLDTTKYEKKSALWGAIQWTEKKKQDDE